MPTLPPSPRPLVRSNQLPHLSFAAIGPYNRTTKKEFSQSEKILLDVIPALWYDRVVEQHFSLFTLESQP